ncbi:hypothetical protein [Mesorhizobium sp.]|uniref:hypothetical protein n=1 Tax=Mesorhizobium sp. TaxID=1871066 RepID=UPI001202E8C7|nr:hypothetical protein [Mesorhizobium sp.]TIL65362.1 MAG: hypothetical protein E5Y77_22415 [Mesorhizobium sp.]
MASIFHCIGDLKLRKKITVAELASVPEDYRIAYMEHDGGVDLELSVRSANYVEEALAEIARLNAEIERLQVEGPARIEAERKARRDDAVDLALHSSLNKAGVKSGLKEGAIAVLKKENEFEAEPSDDGEGFVVLARTPFGLYSVDAIVEQMVSGEEGAAWRDRRTAPSPGYFTGLLSGLKERR